MSDRHSWSLRGPVKSCRLQRSWGASCADTNSCDAQPRSDETSVWFREDGTLERRHHRNFDGSEWTSAYRYSATDRLEAVETLNGDQLTSRRRYEYDKEGRLARIVESSGDSEWTVERLSYDSGRKHRTVELQADKTKSDCMMFWMEETDAGYSALGATTVTFVHGQDDRPIELLFHDANGRVVGRVELTYDENRRVVEDVYHADLPPGLPDLPPTRRVHRYDDRGNRIETEMRLFGLFGPDVTRKRYNAFGDVIEETSESEQCEFNVDEKGRVSGEATNVRPARSESRFDYEYDASGNWLTKIVESRRGTADTFRVSIIEKRTLTYYGP